MVNPGHTRSEYEAQAIHCGYVWYNAIAKLYEKFWKKRTEGGKATGCSINLAIKLPHPTWAMERPRPPKPPPWQQMWVQLDRTKEAVMLASVCSAYIYIRVHIESQTSAVILWCTHGRLSLGAQNKHVWYNYSQMLKMNHSHIESMWWSLILFQPPFQLHRQTIGPLQFHPEADLSVSTKLLIIWLPSGLGGQALSPTLFPSGKASRRQKNDSEISKAVRISIYGIRDKWILWNLFGFHWISSLTIKIPTNLGPSYRASVVSLCLLAQESIANAVHIVRRRCRQPRNSSTEEREDNVI